MRGCRELTLVGLLAVRIDVRAAGGFPHPSSAVTANLVL